MDKISLEIGCCTCGSDRYVINVGESTVTCIKCFKSVLFRTPILKSKKVRSSSRDELRRKWLTISNRAKEKKFGICKYEDFVLWWIITPDVCYYCGGEMKKVHEKGNIISIDRKDNNVGYVIENMVKACFVCNDTKGQYFTEDQMKKMAKCICN